MKTINKIPSPSDILLKKIQQSKEEYTTHARVTKIIQTVLNIKYPYNPNLSRLASLGTRTHRLLELYQLQDFSAIDNYLNDYKEKIKEKNTPEAIEDFNKVKKLYKASLSLFKYYQPFLTETKLFNTISDNTYRGTTDSVGYLTKDIYEKSIVHHTMGKEVKHIPIRINERNIIIDFKTKTSQPATPCYLVGAALQLAAYALALESLYGYKLYHAGIITITVGTHNFWYINYRSMIFWKQQWANILKLFYEGKVIDDESFNKSIGFYWDQQLKRNGDSYRRAVLLEGNYLPFKVYPCLI